MLMVFRLKGKVVHSEMHIRWNGDFTPEPDEPLTPPPRQNSCRPDMILNLGAIRMNDGTVRRSISEQSGGAVVAAGERRCGRGGKRDWSVGADIGTMA
jgi:hypothetical protein